MNGVGGNKKHMFFGIELGFAPSDTPQEEVSELDFFPSLENVVSRNKITGWHHMKIYQSQGSSNHFLNPCSFGKR